MIYRARQSQMSCWVALIYVCSVFIIPSFSSCVEYEQCRNIRLTQSEFEDDIYCYGELSCANTTLDYPNTDIPSIECFGDSSCLDSKWYNIFNQNFQFKSHAAFGISNVTISSYSSTITGEVYGYYSGYLATIYCYNSSQCNINCYGNSCEKLTLICDSTSNCIKSNLVSDYRFVNKTPTEGYYYRGLDLPLAITDATNNHSILYNDDSIVTSMVSNSNHNVCCAAFNSCSIGSNITLTRNAHNSGIYCTAYRSCEGGDFVANYGSLNTTIYCGAKQSCSGAMIIGFTNIYSLGYDALYLAYIETSVPNSYDYMYYYNYNHKFEMNIYLATLSAGGAVIKCKTNDTLNIYCDEYRACAGITLKCFGICNIFCDPKNGIDCLDSQYVTCYSCTYNEIYPKNETNYNYNYNTSYVTSTRTPIATTSSVIANVSTTIGTTIAIAITTRLTENVSSDTIKQKPNITSTKSPINKATAIAGHKKENSVEITFIWNVASYICLISSLTLPFIITIIVRIFHNQEKYVGCDKPNYAAIFAFFWNLGDFYSDIIFAFVLFFKGHDLWYFAMTFAVIPFIISCIVLMKQIREWNNSVFYISYYVNKYDAFLIRVTLITGFYTCVELARSKIFYFKRCCLPLKDVDYIKIQNWRIFNTVLLELSTLQNIIYFSYNL